jgi:hypothetical protein
MVMSSDCVLLGVAHRDRDIPQLGLSKSPVEPRSFALLVLQDHSRRRRRSFCSRSMHGSSTDTRAPRYDLWAQSASYIGRTSILANQAYKRQNLRLSRPGLTVEGLAVGARSASSKPASLHPGLRARRRPSQGPRARASSALWTAVWKASGEVGPLEMVRILLYALIGVS